MSIKLDHSDIQKLAKKAGVNQPVMSVRVVGSRIELHLLGGKVVPVEPIAPDEETRAITGEHATQIQPFTPQDVFQDMTVARLKRVAAYLEMSGYSKLTKARLIAAIISKHTAEEIQEAVVNSALQQPAGLLLSYAPG